MRVRVWFQKNDVFFKMCFINNWVFSKRICSQTHYIKTVLVYIVKTYPTFLLLRLERLSFMPSTPTNAACNVERYFRLI